MVPSAATLAGACFFSFRNNRDFLFLIFFGRSLSAETMEIIDKRAKIFILFYFVQTVSCMTEYLKFRFYRA